MNRTQIIAKAAINGLCFLAVGMFFSSFRFLDSMPSPVHTWSLMLTSAAAGFGILWLFFYGLRTFHLAFKLAGQEPPGTPWLDERFFAAAMRFVSVSAGLLLCYRFIMSFPNLLLQIPHYLSGSVKSGFSVLLYYFGLLLLLPVGIYLLCGAPHFVRWQADKTLEMCKEYAHCDPQENLQQ